MWLPNLVALFLGSLVIMTFALAAAWRIGAWQLPQVELLTTDSGLPIQSIAPKIAAHGAAFDTDLSFEGRSTFLAFGINGCEPCMQLLEAGADHPALRHMRRLYVSDSLELDIDPEIRERWETYRFHDERTARAEWNTPISPFFHVIGPDGRVVEKGIASTSDHLDYLLSIMPAGVGGVVATHSP
jgi:hypothetical protein